MNAMLGFTEMLLDNLYGEVPTALEGADYGHQVNGRHLLRLINDVLDLSKIEAGRMEAGPGEYSVREVIGHRCTSRCVRSPPRRSRIC